MSKPLGQTGKKKRQRMGRRFQQGVFLGNIITLDKVVYDDNYWAKILQEAK